MIDSPACTTSAYVRTAERHICIILAHHQLIVVPSHTSVPISRRRTANMSLVSLSVLLAQNEISTGCCCVVALLRATRSSFVSDEQAVVVLRLDHVSLRTRVLYLLR